MAAVPEEVRYLGALFDFTNISEVGFKRSCGARGGYLVQAGHVMYLNVRVMAILSTTSSVDLLLANAELNKKASRGIHMSHEDGHSCTLQRTLKSRPDLLGRGKDFLGRYLEKHTTFIAQKVWCDFNAAAKFTSFKPEVIRQ